MCIGHQNSGVYRTPELWYILNTRKGYHCLQDTRTLVFTGYQNYGLYRILELLVYTGYQNSSVHRGPELWYIHAIRTLVYTGYQKSTGQISFPVLWILVAWNLYLKTDQRKDTGWGNFTPCETWGFQVPPVYCSEHKFNSKVYKKVCQVSK